MRLTIVGMFIKNGPGDLTWLEILHAPHNLSKIFLTIFFAGQILTKKKASVLQKKQLASDLHWL
jgi:hypothetical protein